LTSCSEDTRISIGAVNLAVDVHPLHSDISIAFSSKEIPLGKQFWLSFARRMAYTRGELRKKHLPLNGSDDLDPTGLREQPEILVKAQEQAAPR
jgi:hypothetical protein